MNQAKIQAQSPTSSISHLPEYLLEPINPSAMHRFHWICLIIYILLPFPMSWDSHSQNLNIKFFPRTPHQELNRYLFYFLSFDHLIIFEDIFFFPQFFFLTMMSHIKYFMMDCLNFLELMDQKKCVYYTVLYLLFNY